MPRAILALAWSPTGAATCIEVDDSNARKGDGTECDKMLDELTRKYGEAKIHVSDGLEVGLLVYEW